MNETELHEIFETLTERPKPSRYETGSVRRTARRQRRARLVVVAAGTAAAVGLGVFVANRSVNSDPPPAKEVRNDKVVPWKPLVPGPTPSPGLEAPLKGAPVVVTLELPDFTPAPDGRYRFVVRLANDGDRPISLNPCPFYRVQFQKSVETGYLNCSEAPGAIKSGQSILFAMEAPGRAFGSHAPVLWQLGTEGSEGVGARGLVRKTFPIPMPKKQNLDVLHLFGGAQRYRHYTGPQPPEVSEADALAKVQGDRVYSLGLRDIGMVHSSGKVTWYHVWIIASDTYVADGNQLVLGRGPNLGGTPHPTPKPRPVWSRGLIMIDAATGKQVMARFA